MQQRYPSKIVIASIMHTLLYGLMLSQRSNTSDIFFSNTINASTRNFLVFQYDGQNSLCSSYSIKPDKCKQSRFVF